MRAIPQVAIDFIKAHEGLRLTAYQDGGGVWTIGYGHTGSDVRAGVVWSQAQADGVLAANIRDAAASLAVMVDRDVIDSLTENQYAALLSFVFNLGTQDHNGHPWTLWSIVNKRQYDQVPGQLVRFVYDGSTKVQGLVNRRNDEIALWSTGEPGSVPDEARASSITREASTPPALTDPVPIRQDKGIITMVGSAIATGAYGVGEVSKAVSPYADTSHTVGKVVAFLALLSAVLAAVGVAIAILKKRQASK